MASAAAGLLQLLLAVALFGLLLSPAKCSVHHLFNLKRWEGAKEFLDSFQIHIRNSTCKNDLLLVVDSVEDGDEWALKMVDAWAKPQTGLLTGNSMHLGNFDECLSIDWQGNNSVIQGQYCSAFIQPNNDDVVDILINNLYGVATNPSGKRSGLLNFLDRLRLSYGICVPKSCSKQNLDEMWEFSKHYFNLSADVEINENFCDYEGKHQLDNFAYFTIILLSMLVSMVIIGTIYEVVFYKDKKRRNPGFLVQFSAYRNSKKILNGKCDDPLCCLNAVRVLSLFWIIVRHYFMLVFYFPHLNGMDMNEWKGESGNMFILSGSMAVDSFFAASGLSVAYIYLKSRESEDYFYVLKYYLHKLLKVMPTLVLVVLIYTSLLTYLGNGPFWPIIHNLFQRDCENNWWSTLLFIANYVHPTNNCTTQGWYLSVDIQLFFLSPLLLIPLSKWPKPTIIATIMITIAAIVQCFIESWTMNLGSTHFDENAAFHTNVIATHIRAPVWLIGFIMGYVLYRCKDMTIRLKKSSVIMLWTASIAIFVIIILGHQTVATKEYNIVRSSIFNTLVRPSWTIALCWVIFAVMNGYGGIAKSILTAPIFNIIIKINFNMFLLHVLPQIYFIGQTRMSTYFNNVHNLYLVLADLAGALLLSFVWTLVVEPWIVVTEDIFFTSHNKEPKICRLSLLKKDKTATDNDIDYVTVEKNPLTESRRESPS